MWQGTSYILQTVRLYTDGARQPFVADPAFIAAEGWSGLVRQVASLEAGTACLSTGGTGAFAAYEKQMRDAGAVEMTGGKLCLTRGVYLEDIDPGCWPTGAMTAIRHASRIHGRHICNEGVTCKGGGEIPLWRCFEAHRRILGHNAPAAGRQVDQTGYQTGSYG